LSPAPSRVRSEGALVYVDKCPRPSGESGFEVVRGGSFVCELSVSFCAEGELVTFSHAAGERIMIARGAIGAALRV
ncbi:dihydrodipicolinate reductase C-terminal domain-containing protein, partial [Mesorhizobium japonicum]|uniref:dihydrodipicolinate reductase C-terminal domain-containing protein n=1 Tax=Mesorhizobium japonicum TaxID=2066070 RepID=UPI003B58E4EA